MDKRFFHFFHFSAFSRLEGSTGKSGKNSQRTSGKNPGKVMHPLARHKNKFAIYPRTLSLWGPEGHPQLDSLY